MASNPIQKKVRNAGLIGAAMTLLLMGIVVAFLLMQLNKIKEEQKKIEESYRTVYTLSQDVKSGQVITEDMFSLSIAQIQHIPNNATSDIATFQNYSLSDSEGNRVYTDEKGMYLQKNSEYMEIFSENNKYFTYLSDGTKEEVKGISTQDLKEDLYGKYLVKATENKTRLYQETATGEYYVLRVKYYTNSENEPVREKEYIDILGTPLIAKIDMNQNTVLTLEMLALGGLMTDDVRQQEYNIVVLPVDLTAGDYVDIRLQLPNGQDFIVVSKKMVELPVIEGMESETTIWMNLSEEEILTMSCAMVEAYRINGSRLYATKYAEPGMQEESTPTYPISSEVYDLIMADPNIVEKAKEALKARYTENETTDEFVNIRNEIINTELQKDENSESNIPSKMNESIVKTQEERKEYLQSIANGY